MAVLISNDGELSVPISNEEIEQVVVTALELEGVPRPVEVSISIVDSEEMRGLNKLWRDIDAPTDVLSFECDSPFDEDIPEDESVELGDIILAPEVIAAQAPDFDTTPEDEFRLMLVHGALHLLGYDHIDSAEAQEMETAELEILRQLASLRGVDPDSVCIGPTTSHLDD